MKRKIFSLICAVLMIASVIAFTGCSNGGSGSSSSGSTGVVGSGE